MADYWKSQPRKFCQYCKCWIADNKPSVEFHERGKNHKENVAAKITEIKKKSIDKAKQEEKACKQFAAMEEAAMKAYEEDLKRMGREAAGLPALPTTTPPKTHLQVRVQPKPPQNPQQKPQGKKQQKHKQASKKFRGPPAAPVWVEGQTEDGHTYYYNTQTGESRWEKPGSFQGGNSFSAQPAQPAQPESSSACLWMEAVSPEGYTYYYNPETGETSWEKPADYPSTEASGAEDIEKEQSEEAPSNSQTETGEEGSSSEVPASQEAEVPEQASQESKLPKISFRKRKAEAEPWEKEGEDKVSDDAPKEAEEMKKEEDVPMTSVPVPEPVPEEKKETVVVPVKTQVKRVKTANPYGAWEKIKEEEDPYANIDLQLPQIEGSTVSAPAELPPEPKPKFKERVITSLGVEGGSASFRKNKTQNGKSRSLRQRDDDD